jgi:hypothetical protein
VSEPSETQYAVASVFIIIIIIIIIIITSTSSSVDSRVGYSEVGTHENVPGTDARRTGRGRLVDVVLCKCSVSQKQLPERGVAYVAAVIFLIKD